MAHSHRGPHPEGQKAGWKPEFLSAGFPHLRRLQGDGGHCSGPTGLGGRVHGFLVDEQTGFRWCRFTADSIADMVSTQQEAKVCGDAVLVPIEIKGAFNGLPHPVLQQALDLLGINGNLRRFIWSFLEECTLRVRVGGSRSSPQPVAAGIPQASVVSPFLFNLALARLAAALPIDPHYPVNASIYADDIVLWVRSPPEPPQLALGPAKSPRHRHCLPEQHWPCYLGKEDGGHAAPPKSSRPPHSCPAVTQRGLRIDHRLPAVKTLHVQVLRIRKAVSQLLARGQGCFTSWALRLYDAAATSRLRYALPLVALPPDRLKRLELQHLAAIRLCLGAPRSSQVAATLAEVGAWPLSLLLPQQGLRHVDRIHHGPDGSALLSRLRSLPHSQMGRLYEEVIGRPPANNAPLPPPQKPPILITAKLPGVCKRRSPTCALQQTAASLLHADQGGHLQVYVDGSVMPDTGSSTAACVVPALRKSRQFPLPDHATSTAAEVAGLHLALGVLAEELPPTPVTIYCDWPFWPAEARKGQPWGRPAL
nr:uncharacterized protein LOC126542928 [Dermacentor andersoni]